MEEKKENKKVNKMTDEELEQKVEVLEKEDDASKYLGHIRLQQKKRAELNNRKK